MSDQSMPRSELLLYQTEDGRTRVQCRLEGDTLWLTQAQIAELFEITPQNVFVRVFLPILRFLHYSTAWIAKQRTI